jgi:uncharacterized membrane protein YkvA (DUF1232 family)
VPKINILDMPIQIEDDLQRLIKRSFFNALADMENCEFDYINKKIKQKIVEINDEQLVWVHRLAKYFKVLHEFVSRCNNKTSLIGEESCKAIGAALFYFINPYDIIPDYTPEIGYADDYYVLTLCLESLCKKDKNLIMKELSKIT